MSDVPAVFNGEAFALTSTDPIWFAMRVADGLKLNAALQASYARLKDRTHDTSDRIQKLSVGLEYHPRSKNQRR